jgi:hypothetical protein
MRIVYWGCFLLVNLVSEVKVADGAQAKVKNFADGVGRGAVAQSQSLGDVVNVCHPLGCFGQIVIAWAGHGVSSVDMGYTSIVP